MKVGLCMIVKNESHVITRCLDSVKRLIDYILIIDTGSTDETESIIKNWSLLNGIPGEVIYEPWKNFSHNRTFALKKLRENEDIDYAFMIDADEILVYEDNFDVVEFKNSLKSQVYEIKTDMGGFIYYRPTLTSNKIDIKYEGVVH